MFAVLVADVLRCFRVSWYPFPPTTLLSPLMNFPLASSRHILFVLLPPRRNAHHPERVCMMNSSCILQETGDISGIKRSSSQLFYYIMSRKCLIKLEIAAEYVRRNPPSSLLFRPEERHFHLSRWCHKWAVHEGSELLCAIIRQDTQLAALVLCFGGVHSCGSEALTKLLIIDVHRLVINNESLQSVFCWGSFSIHDVYRRLTEWVQQPSTRESLSVFSGVKLSAVNIKVFFAKRKTFYDANIFFLWKH